MRLKGLTLQRTDEPSVNELQLISALLVLSMRVAPTSFMSMPGNMALPSDLPSWPVCSLSRLHSTWVPHWSMQGLWYLLFVTVILDAWIQQVFFRYTCFCTTSVLTCLSPFLPELDHVVMQWCCKQGGCGAWGKLHPPKPCSQRVTILLSRLAFLYEHFYCLGSWTY